MLLDLDEGTVTVYQNGVCLGVKKGEGLAGHYCWAVNMNNHARDKSSVRIERRKVPGGYEAPPELPT